jgi:hypothetical protein
MPTLQIVAHDNGFGLSRSQRLLADALRANGYEVLVNGLDDRDATRRRSTGLRLQTAARRWFGPLGRTLPRHDINIMLEHAWPAAFHQARRNVYMPNPEWVDRHDLRYLRRFDLVLGKTHDATDIFARRGMPSVYMGFVSTDNHDAAIPREAAFFHLAGGALIKGTDRLMAVWRRHPEWPRLTVLQDPRRAQPSPAAPNIEHRVTYLSASDPVHGAELRRLQNAHLFHLCPSETDTWGHYIGEAMGVGALTLTTDAPSMNEMVQPDRGLMIAYGRTGMRGLAATYFFDEMALERAVEQAIAMPSEERDRRRERARAWFMDMQQSFTERVGTAMDALPRHR